MDSMLYSYNGNTAMRIYRKLYEQHYGPIPEGWIIHHKDHNHSNNAIENLIAMPRGEHTTHHNNDRITDGSHPFVSRDINSEMIQNGTHPSKGKFGKESVSYRTVISKGKHISQRPEQLRENAAKQIEHGKHPFQKPQLVTCPHCGVTGSKFPMRRWHFDKCKHKSD